ncbi:MAG: 2-amino-4-hydroxy-6-hydroxymethyldihydropteridine diphosphokinase [Dehalococcoidia bacterium]|nr:2-amino-4-hydroxy-6-hydroxymethyldihydropteridine diphosphokinase [Dehalococcoidia bacterium]
MSGFLGFGTNLGDRKKNLAQAMTRLNDRPDFSIIRTSNIYETAPWGVTDQPSFLNMVAEITTSLDPRELLERVKKLEQDMGREEGPRFGPRLIDVDILLLQDLVVDEPDLQIPHASLHLRAFVLVPLAELTPDSVHPVLGETIADLTTRVDGLDGVTPLV